MQLTFYQIQQRLIIYESVRAHMISDLNVSE